MNYFYAKYSSYIINNVVIFLFGDLVTDKPHNLFTNII